MDLPRPDPLSDVDQRELARIVGKEDSSLLGLVFEAVNVRLLTDAEHAALSEVLALDEDDPDEQEAERLAALLAHHSAQYWSSDEPDPPLRMRLRPSEKRRLLALTRAHAPELLPIAHDVNRRWLTDAEVTALEGMLTDVFLDSLDRGSEPTRRGAAADDLTALLQQHRLSFWE